MTWSVVLPLGFAAAIQLGALAFAAGRITARLEALERTVNAIVTKGLGGP